MWSHRQPELDNRAHGSLTRAKWRSSISPGIEEGAACAGGEGRRLFGENPELRYRDLCKRFSLSLGALSKIMRRCRKRQEARERKRLAEPSATFIVRHKAQGQDVTTVVTVKGRATIDQKRHLLSRRYRTGHIVEGDDPSVLRRAECVAQ